MRVLICALQGWFFSCFRHKFIDFFLSTKNRLKVKKMSETRCDDDWVIEPQVSDVEVSASCIRERKPKNGEWVVGEQLVDGKEILGEYVTEYFECEEGKTCYIIEWSPATSQQFLVTCKSVRLYKPDQPSFRLGEKVEF